MRRRFVKDYRNPILQQTSNAIVILRERSSPSCRREPRRLSGCSSEFHRRLIGTGLGSGCAYSIGVGTMAVAKDGIGVETVIQGGGDTRVVAANIDHVRSRAAPGEVHR
jgi:hypothetical protein